VELGSKRKARLLATNEGKQQYCALIAEFHVRLQYRYVRKDKPEKFRRKSSP
jgi:hypothetical protein